jgi:hypothetical protein
MNKRTPYTQPWARDLNWLESTESGRDPDSWGNGYKCVERAINSFAQQSKARITLHFPISNGLTEINSLPRSRWRNSCHWSCWVGFTCLPRTGTSLPLPTLRNLVQPLTLHVLRTIAVVVAALLLHHPFATNSSDHLTPRLEDACAFGTHIYMMMVLGRDRDGPCRLLCSMPGIRVSIPSRSCLGS